MKSIGDRIRARRKELKLTQAELGRKVGISSPAISQLEKGESKSPSSDNLLTLSKALSCSPEWLQTGIASPVAFTETKFINIPILDVELAAGVGIHIDMEEVTDWVPISQDWICANRLPESHLVVVRVSGDSMSPRLQDGDMLLVNTADKQPMSGKVYAIANGDELRVKRLIKQMSGSWVISSDNKHDPAYQDELVPPHEFTQLRVVGRVIKVLMGDV